MGKHFSAAELGSVLSWKANGRLQTEILRKLKAARRRRREAGASLKSVGRALKGQRFRRAGVETRGRWRVFHFFTKGGWGRDKKYNSGQTMKLLSRDKRVLLKTMLLSWNCSFGARFIHTC